jgi:hypothetical protein
VKQKGKKKMFPQPVFDFDDSRCAARVWARGRGWQCSRAPLLDGEYCSQHKAEANTPNGLVHGRIDQPVPSAKVQEFLDARSESSTEPSEASFEDSSQLPIDIPWRAGTSSDEPFLSEISAVLVFSFLQQSEKFRSAMVCISWYNSSRVSPLRCFDARSVGIWRTVSGRRTVLTAAPLMEALWAFCTQKRFCQVKLLDLRNVWLGGIEPENCHLLQHIAKHCPDVRQILMDRSRPFEVWGDLARKVTPAFSRSLLRWWPLKTGEVMVIEGYGQRYMLSGHGSVEKMAL